MVIKIILLKISSCKICFRLLFVTLLLLIIVPPGFSRPNAVNFNKVEVNKSLVEQFGKFELAIELNRQFENPYDFNEVAIMAIFTSPTGKKDTVDGFFIENWILPPLSNLTQRSGDANFAVRFSPTVAGKWEYELKCISVAGNASYPPRNFTCVDSQNLGYIEINSNNYVGYTKGQRFIPVGENMNVPATNVFSDYKTWISKLAENGGNAIYTWMVYKGFGLEWSANRNKNFKGLLRYNQQNAYHLDWLLEYCRQKKVFVFLALNSPGNDASTENPGWKENPYNIANGGPCDSAWQFFTNKKAINILKNRLRYIVARYGYSTQILSWDLFVEVDNLEDYSHHVKEIVQWHKTMAAYLKQLDVNKHLVSTSFSNDNREPAIWNLKDIDFTETHLYAHTPNPEKLLVQLNHEYLEKYRKPTFTTEFGIDANNINLAIIDPNGIYLHNVLWATGLSGSGPALTYWWHNYVHPQNLYYHFKSVSSFLSAGLSKNENYTPTQARIINGGSQDINIIPNNGWGQKDDTSFRIDQSGLMTPRPQKLGVYMFGTLLNNEYHKPSEFLVEYLKKGEFKVEISDATRSASLMIKVDGQTLFDADVKPNSNYSVPVYEGTHNITLVNPGLDWLRVKRYTFTGSASLLNSYVLANATKSKAAGYVLNSDYNYQKLFDREKPMTITGSSLMLKGMANGKYRINFFETLSARVIKTIEVNCSKNELLFDLPPILWDVAFVAEKQ